MRDPHHLFYSDEPMGIILTERRRDLERGEATLLDGDQAMRELGEELGCRDRTSLR
jgi:hypothetical protein